MLFNSLTFLVFFVVVVALYWALPHRVRWALLLVASYVFYGCWNPAYLVLLFGLTASTYFFSFLISSSKGMRRKLMLVASILVSFGSLVYFKYLDLFGQSANGLFALFGVDLGIPMFNILLPIGISFQTFQNVGYLIDVYRGKITAEKNFLRYALFISYFPQLVAGPIERASNLMPQLSKEHSFCYSETALGLRMMLVGFFKKVAVADTIAIYVDVVYENVSGGGFEGPALVFATFLFAFQIYCDFSGYSDIAIGASKVFGIDLMTNFRSPYLSRNPQEFWRRWHISLSTWFQDYVYIPLGGSRVKVPRYVLNILITFTVSGLWHGASWNFVIWGAFHGILVASYVLLHRFGKSIFKGKTVKRPGAHAVGVVLSVVATFVLVDIGWIFFRADTLADAWFVLSNLTTGWSFDLSVYVGQLSLMGFDKETLLFVALLLVALFVIDLINYRTPVAERLGKCSTPVRWTVYIAVSYVVVFAFMFTAQSQNFIYFQF